MRGGDQLELDFGVSTLDDYDQDDVPQIATDSPALDDDEGTLPAERLMPKGFYSRNLDPEKGGGEKNAIGLGTPHLEIRYGDRRYVIPLNDPRDIGKVPKLRKGGAMMAGGAGEHRSFMMIDGEDPSGDKQPGSIMIAASYTSGGTKKTLGVSMNVRDSGKEEISLVHGEGARVTVGKKSTTITSPDGKTYTEVSNSGNILGGNSKALGSLVVGQQLAAMPVALGPVVAACFTALAASVVALNPGAPAAVAPFLKLLQANHLKAT